jgi:hypothetical protein
MKYTKECPHCHSKFSTDSAKRKYCNTLCNSYYRTSKKIKDIIPHLVGEIWKGIEGSIDFKMISNYGRVKIVSNKGIKSEKLYTGSSACGYRMTGYKTIDGYIRVLNHRLVAKAFIPNPDNKPQVNHINSIRSDNRVENLEWVTQNENFKHAYMAGRVAIGVKNPASKLTEKDVLDIRNTLKERGELGLKIYYGNISKTYGVSRTAISNIHKLKTWKHLV